MFKCVFIHIGYCSNYFYGEEVRREKMGRIADEVKAIIKDTRARVDKDENFMKILSEAYSKFFGLGKETKSKELAVIAFLWRDMEVPLRAITEKEMRRNFPRMLEKDIKGEGRELARSFLNFLSRKDLEKIAYYSLIDYERGEIDFDEIKDVFEIDEPELPMEEKGFVILTIARELDETWKEAYKKNNELVKKYIDELDEKLKSMESDEEVLSTLRKATEDILYALHLKALGD